MNKIKSRIVFRIKTGYKLEFLSSETMELLRSGRKMLIKIKIVEMYQIRICLSCFSAFNIINNNYQQVSKKYCLLLYLINNLVN